MDKRGQIVLKGAIILGFAVFVVLSFSYLGNKIGSRDTLKREIASKEIALILDEMYAYPYDTVINYEKDLSGLTVEILNGEVIVYDSRFFGYNQDPLRKKYPFFQTGDAEIKARLENPKIITLQKTNNALTAK